jgi:hypothetical protein
MIDPTDDEISAEYDKHIEAMEKPFWEPIGEFIFRFGNLERKVDESLSLLMGIEFYFVGMYPLGEISFLPKVKLLSAFSRGSDLQVQMKDVAGEIEDLNSFRNDLVHGPWVAQIQNIDGAGSTAWQKFGLSRSHRPKARNITIADISSNAAKAVHLTHQVTQICQRIVEARKAPPAGA